MKRRKVFIFLVMLLNFILLARLGYSQINRKFTLSPGFSSFNGHTTTEASKGNSKTESRYSFNSTIATIAVVYQPIPALELQLSYSNDFFDMAGNYEKRQYGLESDSSDTLSVYNSGETNIDTTIIEFNIVRPWDITEQFNVSLIGSYLYEKFYFEVSKTSQNSPSGLSGYSSSNDDKSVEYDLSYVIFAIGAEIGYRFELVNISAGYFHGVSVNSEDKESQLESNQETTGTASGSYQALFVSLNFNITKRSSFSITNSQRKLELEGSQTQTESNGSSEEWDTTLSSDQNVTTVAYRLSF